MATSKRRRSAGKSSKKPRSSPPDIAGENAGSSADARAASAGEAIPSVGLEGAGISVEVDRAALLAEADAIAGTAPANDAPVPAQDAAQAQDAPAVQIDPSAKASAVEPMLSRVIDRLGKRFAPNWGITKEESTALGSDLAIVMAYWMPDDVIQPKWMALLSLGMTAYAIADARQDPETGDFKPLRVKPIEVKAPTQSPASTGAQLSL